MINVLDGMLDFMRAWRSYYVVYDQLNKLSNKDLRVLGLSRCDIHDEAMKSFMRGIN